MSGVIVDRSERSVENLNVEKRQSAPISMLRNAIDSERLVPLIHPIATFRYMREMSEDRIWHSASNALDIAHKYNLGERRIRRAGIRALKDYMTLSPHNLKDSKYLTEYLRVTESEIKDAGMNQCIKLIRDGKRNIAIPIAEKYRLNIDHSHILNKI